MSVRKEAAKVLTRVLSEGESLTAALATLPDTLTPTDQAWVKAACYGVLRDYPRLRFHLQQLITQPVKIPIIDSLLLLGLYQLTAMQVKNHAAVSETVAATPGKQRWAKGLVNGVLRSFLRRQQELTQAAEANSAARLAHPDWLIERIRQDWPEHAAMLLAANNRQAPLTVRVNSRRISREQYLALIQQQGLTAQIVPELPMALKFDQALPVTKLPGFQQGLVSVQDGAAQWAAPLLALSTGLKVLDACAAPGGKTGHLLELCPDIELLALDIAESRLAKIAENLSRLGLSATLRCADAALPEAWWDGRPFERILLDAPCSGSGVIRRHPDIKLHRRPEDIHALASHQRQLLEALWPLLARGGLLLYVTCSIFKEENEHQIEAFLARHNDAEPWPETTSLAKTRPLGQQFLTGHFDLDGFYYARLRKT